MAQIQGNKTELNVSGDCFILTPLGTNYGAYISSTFLMINFVVGIPANLWVVLLICKGPTKILSSELHYLSLAIAEMTYCLALPTELFCIYASEDMRRGARWIFQPHQTFSILLNLQIGMVWMARPIFQCCICMERYIAVVHPLLYIR